MSLKIAFIVVFFALIIALVLGAVAAYYGGVVDGIIMRICDVFLSVPHLLLAVTVVAALGTGVDKLIIALTIAQIPTFIRIVRSAILQVMNSDFIECAKAYGTKDFRLIVTQILPNALSPIIVKTTQDFASIILQISSLGFIGLGVPSPTPEWGTMVAEARSLMRSHPTMMIYPGIAITITVLAINLIGDGLRDALDPKLKN